MLATYNMIEKQCHFLRIIYMTCSIAICGPSVSDVEWIDEARLSDSSSDNG